MNSGTHTRVYTDGSCLKNPGGAGGWAAIILEPGADEIVLAGRDPSTSNNRMELMGPIVALERIDPGRPVLVLTDSQYVILCATKVAAWRQRKRKYKNRDLVDRLALAIARHRTVRWQWVRGHAGNAMNGRADLIAGRQARSVGGLAPATLSSKAPPFPPSDMEAPDHGERQ